MPDDALGDLSAVDSAQLEVWAFGRRASVADRELAEAALLELARRAEAQHDTASADTASTDENADDYQPKADEIDDADTEPEPERRRRLTRLAVVLAVGILAVATAATALLIAGPRQASSLDIFDRAETPVEAELRQQLQRVGQRVNIGPRLLTEDYLGITAAYRSSSEAGGPVDRVCLAIIEPMGVGDWSCVPESEFTSAGAEFTLYGIDGVTTVQWGPDGAPIIVQPEAIDLGPLGGPRELGDYRDVLLREQSADDLAVGLALGAANITVEHGPVVIVPLTALYNVQSTGFVADWSAVSPDPETDVVVCLGVIDLPPADENGDRTSPGTIRESLCDSDDDMVDQGLRFEVPTGSGTAVFLWNNRLGLRASIGEV